MADRYRRRLYELLRSFYMGVLAEDYFEDSAEQRLYRKIYFETFRHLGFIEKCLRQLYKELPGPDLRAALALGASQILFMDDIPDYAAVNESVTLVQPNKKSFVNAVLRNLIRRKEEFQANYSVREDFPGWFVKRWEKRLGEDLEAFLYDLNTKPSFYGINRDTMVLEKLEERSDNYIMDKASFAIAKLAGDCTPMSVLDCCAAPGGKTFVLSETYPDARIFAVEKNPARFEKLKENMAGMGLGNVDCVNSDIMELKTEAEFDLVLLDAPCTAIGTIKRHPEVRWFRNLDSLRENGALQLEMLKKVSTFISKGGIIIYSVCSMEPEETTDVIEAFLKHDSSFQVIEPSCDAEFKNGKYFLSLPYKNDSDGFFGAVLTKNF
ncbi:MAG: hypothetical protein C0602_03670 [Denitrovibrio sp.]|nr:MAG: hypothetical protein C0602_03670 [Denitrovibrio sp.]